MPNQGVPVIFKNKIAYGYAEKSVQAYDVSVSDYNALTEQQQLDGSIRFIQGVDAIPNGSNVWAKLGTTPLAEGLPRDCSQAVNELKSNLTPKKVSHNFTGINNNSSTTYYLTLSNDVTTLSELSGVNMIISATISDWNGVGNALGSINIVLSESNKLYVLFPKGAIFSNGSLEVTFVYI